MKLDVVYLLPMSQDQSTLLHVVCDYKAGGMEFGEISSRLQYHLDNPHGVRIHPTEVPPLDTMAIGFVTAQYAFFPIMVEWLSMETLLLVEIKVLR